jgi:hypothetical protein
MYDRKQKLIELLESLESLPEGKTDEQLLSRMNDFLGAYLSRSVELLSLAQEISPNSRLVGTLQDRFDVLLSHMKD